VRVGADGFASIPIERGLSVGRQLDVERRRPQPRDGVTDAAAELSKAVGCRTVERDAEAG